MAPEDRAAQTQRIIFGVILIALGLVFTLDRMDILDVGSLWYYWPLALVALGLGKVLQPAGSPGRGFGLVLVVAGAWLTLYNTGVIDFGIRDFWPVLLILFGLTLLWRALRRPRAAFAVPPDAPPMTALTGAEATPSGDATADTGDASFDPTVNMVAILGGAERICASRAFRGGDLTAVMGGCELDLRHARTAPGGAVIETFAMWGGVEIRVPEDWAVSMQGTPILGGFEDTRRPTVPPSGPMLVVRGFAIMGAVEIKS